LTTLFRERGNALEAKFAHDEEFRFRANARRDKLFARWMAATLRLDKDASSALVKAVLAIPDGPGHDEAVLRYATDFASEHGLPGLASGLVAALDACALRALKELNEAPFERELEQEEQVR
jgi:hypothetical protein